MQPSAQKKKPCRFVSASFLTFFLFFLPGGLIAQTTSRLPHEPQNWLHLSYPSRNGDRDLFAVIFFEVPDTIASTLYFAVNDAGIDGNAVYSPDMPPATGVGYSYFYLIGGPGAISDPNSRLTDYGTSRTLANTGTTLTYFKSDDTAQYNSTWSYFAGVSPSQGEHIGNKYYFKIVAEIDATTDKKNAFQVDISYNNSGAPTGIEGVRTFCYSWPVTPLNDTGNTWNMYPFVPEGATGNIEYRNFDFDSAEAGRAYDITGTDRGAVTSSNDGAAQPAGAVTSFAIGAASNGTWRYQITETTGGPAGGINTAEVWFTSSATLETYRAYSSAFIPPAPDHVVLSLVDGIAIANGTDTERVTLQVVAADGSPLPYSKNVYVAVNNGALINESSVGLVVPPASSTVVRTDASGLGYVKVARSWVSDITVTVTLLTDGTNGSDNFGAGLDGTAAISFLVNPDPTISSLGNKSFNKGDAPVTLTDDPIFGGKWITVKDSPVTPKITAANDIRIRIPDNLDMVFDPSANYVDGTSGVTYGGTAAAKVNTTAGSVSYPDSKTVQIDVISSFAINDTLGISGLRLMSFNSESSGHLLLSFDVGATYPSVDDKAYAVYDLTPPTIVSGQTQDLDGDGYLDAVRVVFSEAIKDSTVAGAQFAVSGAGVGVPSFSSTTASDTANDADLYLTFTDGVLAGNATPTLSYTQGTLTDLSNNLLATSGPTGCTDLAGPVLMGASTADPNSDGTVERLALTFSEPVNDATAAAGDFSLDAGTVSAIGDDGGNNDAVIWLTVNGVGAGTAVRPTVSLAAAAITDTAASPVANPAKSRQATDGAGPAIVGAQTLTTTTVQVSFSEPVSDTSLAAADFVLAGFAPVGANGAPSSVGSGATADDNLVVLTPAAGLAPPEAGTVAFSAAGVVLDRASPAQGSTQTAAVAASDGIAPAAPVGLDLAAGDDTGGSNADNITSQTAGLTISGSAEANASVALSSSVQGPLGSAAADGAGAWSLDVSLTAGAAHALTAVAQDAAGNGSSTSAALTVTIDNTAPTVVLSDDHADAIVRDADSVTITATFTEADQVAEGAATPTISIGGVVSGALMTRVDNLHWTYAWDVPAGSDGTAAVSVAASDRAGNGSAVATGKTGYTLDNTAPGAPATPTAAAGPYINAAEKAGGVGVQVGLGGSGAEAGDELRLLLGVGDFAPALVHILAAGETASYAFTVAGGQLGADGVKLISARLTDVAGNEGPAAGVPLSLLVDATAPTVVLSDDHADAIARDADSVTITATFTEADQIAGGAAAPTITIGGVVGGAAMDATADNLVWTYSWDVPAGNDGDVPVSVAATDRAGNASQAATGQTAYTIDNTAPTVVLGDNHADAIARDADSVTITATFTEADQVAEGAATPTISIGGVVSGALMTRVDNLHWTYAWDVPAGSDGTAAVSVAASDRAGNGSAAATGKTAYTLDNTAPTVPTALELADSDDTGVSSTDNLTRLTSALTISGSAEANASVALSSSVDGPLGTTSADGAGAWSLEVGLSANVAHAITAMATDAAGNASPASAALAVTVDTAAPPGYTVTIGPTAVTTANQTAFSFTFAAAEVGSTYNYAINDTDGATAAVSGSGTVTAAGQQLNGIDLTSLTDGTLTLSATLTDAAGNAGAAATASVVKDTSVGIRYTLAVAGRNRIYVRFVQPVRRSGGGGMGTTSWTYRGADTITSVQPLNASSGYAEEIVLVNSTPISTDDIMAGALIEVTTPLEDEAANLINGGSHIVSDIALGVMEPLWASGDTAGGLAGTIRTFDGTATVARENDITLSSRILAASAEAATSALYFDVNVPAAKIRNGFWLPAPEIAELVPAANGEARTLAQRPAANGIRDFIIPKNDPELAEGARVEFLLKVGSLYSARVINPDEPWTVAPWAFRVRGIKQQRGGVTILKNVIDPSRGEQTEVRLTLPKAGLFTVNVFTLDGDIVKVLSRRYLAAGTHALLWDGKNRSGQTVARGVYFVRVVGEGIDETRKVLVVR